MASSIEASYAECNGRPVHRGHTTPRIYPYTRPPLPNSIATSPTLYTALISPLPLDPRLDISQYGLAASHRSKQARPTYECKQINECFLTP